MGQVLGTRWTRPIGAQGSVQPGIAQKSSGRQFLGGAGSDLDGKTGKEGRSRQVPAFAKGEAGIGVEGVGAVALDDDLASGLGGSFSPAGERVRLISIQLLSKARGRRGARVVGTLSGDGQRPAGALQEQ